MLIHDLITRAAEKAGERLALGHKDSVLNYKELHDEVTSMATGLAALDLKPRDRVAIWLPKQLETVIAIFATSYADGCFVPINPVLKPAQVAYQLEHSDAVVLITSRQRYESLLSVLCDCNKLVHIVIADDDAPPDSEQFDCHSLSTLPSAEPPSPQSIDADMAAILYTSGSTGKPKGVVLSHRNLVAGAESVASYLQNDQHDRILSVLPLSFDAGLSQLTTGFYSGAYVHLMDYLMPRDVLRAVARHQITGITGVPSLWNPLSRLDWPDDASKTLRYLANTGGAMPESTTKALGKNLPDTELFLMYGLTEAFRSTFLPPGLAQSKPHSVGQAIPNAQILIVNEQGEECLPGEHGELVHRGVHVALGYWKNPDATLERFKPAPVMPAGLPRDEIAVWSGDTAYRDVEGDIFFVSRTDSMIKTSGYRVSPTEIEEEAMTTPGVNEAAAFGVFDDEIGQSIVLYVASEHDASEIEAALRKLLSSRLPAFMVPRQVVVAASLPLNPNGKIDRPRLQEQFQNDFHSE